MTPGPKPAQPPPGPRLPRWLQTLAFVFAPLTYIEACRRRYGDVVTLGTLADPSFVMVFEPQLVKQVVRAPPEEMHQANAVLARLHGESSVQMVDGPEHRRLRLLLQPHFHGARMRAHEALVRDAADREIDSWPVNRTFSLLPSMRSLTLDVIVTTTLGIHDRSRREEVKMRVRGMLDPVAARPTVLAATLSRGRLGGSVQSSFETHSRRLDELLYEEIARRRAEPDLERRDDLLSTLVLAHDDDAAPMGDEQVRDQLVSVVTGHESTAIALAWTLELLLSHTKVLQRLRSELARDDGEYLDAVLKEALRARTVVAGFGRQVAERPFALGGYEIPAGTEINPSIAVIHRRRDLHPDPGEFRPERFLGSDKPDMYTWVPFGGGTRRCLGASFAIFEMGIIVARVLERTRLVSASSSVRRLRRPFGHVVGPDRRIRRGVVGAPSGGGLVRQERKPAPATDPATAPAQAAAL